MALSYTYGHNFSHLQCLLEAGEIDFDGVKEYIMAESIIQHATGTIDSLNCANHPEDITLTALNNKRTMAVVEYRGTEYNILLDDWLCYYRRK